MKTIFDCKKWIIEELLNNRILSVINGGVYMEERPKDSPAEDIVINSVTLGNQYLQRGVFNVNCYAPKKSIKTKNGNQLIRDDERLRVISTAVYKVLSDCWRDECHIEIESQQTFEDEKADFYNFRLEIFIYPTH